MDRERIVSVKIIEPASVPVVPVKSKLERLALLSAPLGLLLGVAVAIGIQMLQGTLDTAMDAERATGLHVLASVPFDRSGGGTGA
jgi:tyrosine-protein kinase Etk/Wzc